ncbi:MAG: ABC transporter substrate-binding protein [Solirubrobacterales bacterium]
MAKRRTYAVWLLTLFFTVSVLLAGCGGQTGPSSVKDTLIYARGGDCRSLDPAMVDDGESNKVLNQLYEGLLAYKPGSAELQPALATSWSSNADETEWIFHLRRNVKFHDGTDFNAQAVKFSIERQMPPNDLSEMPYAEFVFGNVKSVRVLDPYTVAITLKSPNAAFLANLAMGISAPIVSPTAVRKYGTIFTEHPVGTGPFQFVRWERGQAVYLKRNALYWGVKPQFSKVVFQVVKENKVRADRLITGEADIIDGVNPDEVASIKDQGMMVLMEPGVNINFLAFYTDKPPFNDPELRKAISMAINRDYLVKNLYQGYAVKANGPLPKNVVGYDKNLKPYEYNPDQAKAILKKLGKADFSFTAITYSIPRPYNAINGEKLAQAVQQDLKKIGVTMIIKVYTWTDYRKAITQGEGDAGFYGWVGDNGDPDNFLYSLLESHQPRGLNVSRYSNPAFDVLVQQARETSDAKERTRLYSQAQLLLLKDAPWVFLSHGVDMYATSPKVKGFNIHPTGFLDLRPVTKE